MGEPVDFRNTAAPAALAATFTPADLAILEARWIDPELARRARLRRVDPLTGCERVGPRR